MQDLIFKIEQTLDVVIPFIVLVFSVLDLTGVIQVVDKVSPILYGSLALLQSTFKIWGITLRQIKS
jgi:hypothetical protein